MGNSDSRCCDRVKDKKKERVSTYGKQNTEMCNSVTEPQFYSSVQSKNDGKSHNKKNADIPHSTATDSSSLTTVAQIHTPAHNHVQASQQENNNVHDCDPRSPSNGITRTPIHLLEEETVCSLVDPRSPTSGVTRTPLVVLEKCAAKSETNSVVRNIHDPRSPTTSLSRTPLNMLNTGNLRRTVLLSNLMSSPVSSKSPSGNDDNGQPHSNDATKMLCPTDLNVFNFSGEVDWNTSLSSSTAANAGSDPQLSFSEDLSQNLSVLEDMEEKRDTSISQLSEEDIADDVNASADESASSCDHKEIATGMMEIQPPACHSVVSSNAILDVADQHVFSKGEACMESKQLQDFEQSCDKSSIDLFVQNQDVYKASCSYAECDAEEGSLPITQKEDENESKVVKKPKSQIPSGIKSSALLRKRSFSSGLPSQSKGSVEKIPLSFLPLSAEINSSERKHSSTKDNGPQKKYIKNVLNETKRTRSPLAVLGHSNSPEPRRVSVSNTNMGDARPAGLKLTSSRLPRYKGNLAGRPRSSSLSTTRIFHDSRKQRARQSEKENQ